MRPEDEIERDWQDVCDSGRRSMEVTVNGNYFGDITGEAFIGEDAGDEGDFVKMIQKIRKPNGEDWIRFTYYVKRRPDASWDFAGQFSLMVSLDDARRLLKKAGGAGIL